MARHLEEGRALCASYDADYARYRGTGESAEDLKPRTREELEQEHRVEECDGLLWVYDRQTGELVFLFGKRPESGGGPPSSPPTAAGEEARGRSALGTLEEVAARQERLGRQLRDVQAVLLLLAQRQERSPHEEDRRQAAALRRALQQAVDRKVWLRCTDLARDLKKSARPGLEDLQKALDQSRSLRHDLRAVLGLLRADGAEETKGVGKPPAEKAEPVKKLRGEETRLDLELETAALDLEKARENLGRVREELDRGPRGEALAPLVTRMKAVEHALHNARERAGAARADYGRLIKALKRHPRANPQAGRLETRGLKSLRDLLADDFPRAEGAAKALREALEAGHSDAAASREAQGALDRLSQRLEPARDELALHKLIKTLRTTVEDLQHQIELLEGQKKKREEELLKDLLDQGGPA
jgi:hypothetical protein